MINSIKSGIAKKLDDTFVGVPIFTDEIKQGLTEPCFFIKTVSSGQDPLLGRRFMRRQSFDVHYFPPKSESENSSISNVLEHLYEVLEFIYSDGSLLRGTGMNHEQVDGVLHFIVNYNLPVLRDETPQELMENLDLDAHL